MASDLPPRPRAAAEQLRQDRELESAMAALETAEKSEDPEAFEAAIASAGEVLGRGALAELADTEALAHSLAIVGRGALLELGRLRISAAAACDAFVSSVGDPELIHLPVIATDSRKDAAMMRAMIELGKHVGRLMGWRVVELSGRFVLVIDPTNSKSSLSGADGVGQHE